MRQKRIAICSLANDLHAHVMRRALKDRHGVICEIVETDRICGSAGLSWFTTEQPEQRLALLPLNSGDYLDTYSLDAIWWRRFNHSQCVPVDVTDEAHLDVINTDCRETLLGLLLTSFTGRWVSHPLATQYAERKLVQLHAAQRLGFRVPRTLVSQDPVQIQQFCEALDYQAIIKPVKGTIKAQLLTTQVNTALFDSPASLRLCPAIYQEMIPGTNHLRINCFGDAIYATLIESPDLDWRPSLERPMRVFPLAESLKERLRALLHALDLRMGIVDMKIDARNEDGEPVWLEINPQGQFLFQQPLTGLDLVSACSDFLYDEMSSAISA